MHSEFLPPLRDTPEAERPRERMLRHGSGILSDTELLAVLLRTGRQGLDVLETAREILLERGGLGGLPGITYDSLRRSGLGVAKATSVLAALELACRLARGALPPRRLMTRPETVANYLGLRYGRPDQEVMGGLFLDVRHRLIGEQEFFRGTLHRASVEPRVILKEALVRGAGGILLFHTHPSGDPSPSAEDLMFTRRMVDAGDVVGVTVIDHMILGVGGGWVSLRQRRGW